MLGITIANNINQLFSTDKEIAKIIALLNLPITLVDFKNNAQLPQPNLFPT